MSEWQQKETACGRKADDKVRGRKQMRKSSKEQ